MMFHGPDVADVAAFRTPSVELTRKKSVGSVVKTCVVPPVVPVAAVDQGLLPLTLFSSNDRSMPLWASEADHVTRSGTEPFTPTEPEEASATTLTLAVGAASSGAGQSPSPRPTADHANSVVCAWP